MRTEDASFEIYSTFTHMYKSFPLNVPFTIEFSHSTAINEKKIVKIN